MKNIMHKIHQYTAILEPDKDGGFTVTIPALPGCISEGDTFEEALENIKEAASLYIETIEEENAEVPEEEPGIIVAPIQIKT